MLTTVQGYKPVSGVVLEMDDLNDFIDGCLEVLPSPETTHQHSSVISDVYYLLADEYLKSGDNQLSYHMHACRVLPAQWSVVVGSNNTCSFDYFNQPFTIPYG